MKHRQTGRMFKLHRDRVRHSGGDGGAFWGEGYGVWVIHQTFWGYGVWVIHQTFGGMEYE